MAKKFVFLLVGTLLCFFLSAVDAAEMRGVLRATFFDGLNRSNSDEAKKMEGGVIYSLDPGDGRKSVRLSIPDELRAGLKSGQLIAVEGDWREKVLNCREIRQDISQKSHFGEIANEAQTTGEQRVLPVYLQFIDAPPIDGLNENDLNEVVFDHELSPRSYVEYNSFNKGDGKSRAWLVRAPTGDNLGWVMMDKPLSDYQYGGGHIDTYSLFPDAVARLDDIVDFSKVDRLILFLGGATGPYAYSSAGNMGFHTNDGGVEISACMLWAEQIWWWQEYDWEGDDYDQTHLFQILSHELLHGFGLSHSDGWILSEETGCGCADAPVYPRLTQCPSYGYEGYDVMGGELLNLQPPSKVFLEWMEEENDELLKLEPEGETQTITLRARSSTLPGKKYAKIMLGNFVKGHAAWLLVEYIVPTGMFDKFLYHTKTWVEGEKIVTVSYSSDYCFSPNGGVFNSGFVSSGGSMYLSYMKKADGVVYPNITPLINAGDSLCLEDLGISVKLLEETGDMDDAEAKIEVSYSCPTVWAEWMDVAPEINSEEDTQEIFADGHSAATFQVEVKDMYVLGKGLDCEPRKYRLRPTNEFYEPLNDWIIEFDQSEFYLHTGESKTVSINAKPVTYSIGEHSFLVVADLEPNEHRDWFVIQSVQLTVVIKNPPPTPTPTPKPTPTSSPTPSPTPTPMTVKEIQLSSEKVTVKKGQEIDEIVTLVCDEGKRAANERVTATVAKGKRKVSVFPSSAISDKNGQAVFKIKGLKKGRAEIFFRAQEVNKSLTAKVKGK